MQLQVSLLGCFRFQFNTVILNGFFSPIMPAAGLSIGNSLFLNKFIYLVLAALGLCCREQRLLFVAVRGLLIVVASLVVEHGL